ncbi:MAG TPA: 8-amino-7-oxononanoate synthase [Acidimicrobiales bacterium]|nr:8-amino-7-oxononanoate synthase [Acidimicrobiales bacterium]
MPAPRPDAVAAGWSGWVDDELAALRAQGRWREHRRLDARGPTGVLDGRPVTTFAANDYLGLSAHPAVVAAAQEAAERWGTGATASRLVVGNRPVHDDLEEALAEWKGTEAALVLPTGYQANLGVLATLADRQVSAISDELNHASIIDGLRLGRTRVAVSRHNDVDHVRALLARAEGRRLVVTDTVFSMDGDVAPVDDLAAACAEHGALLVLDEAHAVLGPDVSVRPDVDVLRVGTLSKALGALGGFVAGPRRYVDLLRNRARSHIFTTGLSPVDAAAALAALTVARSEAGAALVARLRGHVDRLRPGHPSPILPVVVGEEAAALEASDALLDRGLLVPAIRPPTVPPGTSRLRIALSAAHTDADVDALGRALAELGLAP